MGREIMTSKRDWISGGKLSLHFNYDVIKEVTDVESWPGGFTYVKYDYRGRGYMTRETTKKTIDFEIYSSEKSFKSGKELFGFQKNKSLDTNLEDLWKKLKSQERKGGGISLP
jgi:hypothetical protein